MKSNTIYQFATRVHSNINKQIRGHFCMTPGEAVALASVIYDAGDGDHLEIGTMWGASAILAALTKKEYGLKGNVVVVDPFCDADAGGHGQPDAKIFWANMEIMGVEDRIELIEKHSAPWPVGNRKFASALIDGDHQGEWPKTDWNNVRQHAKIVIFHDYLKEEERTVFQLVNRIKEEIPVYLHGERIVAFEMRNHR